jgi:hypothetical protein
MNRKTLACVCVLSFVLASLILVTTGKARLDSIAEARISADSRLGPVSRSDGPVRMVRFIVSDTGIYPRRQTMQEGVVRLAHEDKTSKSEGLVLERVNETTPTRVVVIKTNESRLRGAELVRLTAGVYRVYDSSSPMNTAELIVETK